jgi:hypothetical protein
VTAEADWPDAYRVNRWVRHVMHIDETHALQPLERWWRDEIDLPETFPSAHQGETSNSQLPTPKRAHLSPTRRHSGQSYWELVVGSGWKLGIGRWELTSSTFCRTSVRRASVTGASPFCPRRLLY